MHTYMYDFTYRKVGNDSISSGNDCKFVIKKEFDDIANDYTASNVAMAMP